MISPTCTWSSQRLCRCTVRNHTVLDIINAAGMDETYGTYVDDEWCYIHEQDDDTDDDTDDDADDDTKNDDTDTAM